MVPDQKQGSSYEQHGVWFAADLLLKTAFPPWQRMFFHLSWQRLCSSSHLLCSSSFSSHCSPSSAPLFPPAVLWDVMMLWQAWRLFLEVLVFLCHGGGGGHRNSAGVVVYSVGVGSREGRDGWALWDLSHCIDRRETREGCVSWLTGCKFSLGSLTHSVDEQYYLSRQSWCI